MSQRFPSHINQGELPMSQPTSGTFTHVFIRFWDLTVLARDKDLSEKNGWITAYFCRLSDVGGSTFEIRNVDFREIGHLEGGFDDLDDGLGIFLRGDDLDGVIVIGIELQTRNHMGKALYESDLSELQERNRVPVFIPEFDAEETFTGYQIIRE